MHLTITEKLFVLVNIVKLNIIRYHYHYSGCHCQAYGAQEVNDDIYMDKRQQSSLL